jgi:hypothetical protein
MVRARPDVDANGSVACRQYIEQRAALADDASGARAATMADRCTAAAAAGGARSRGVARCGVESTRVAPGRAAAPVAPRQGRSARRRAQAVARAAAAAQRRAAQPHRRLDLGQSAALVAQSLSTRAHRASTAAAASRIACRRIHCLFLVIATVARLATIRHCVGIRHSRRCTALSNSHCSRTSSSQLTCGHCDAHMRKCPHQNSSLVHTHMYQSYQCV